MEKTWYESKTVWGFLGFSVFGIWNTLSPNPALVSLVLASLGWAGYGFRDSQE